jgi:hypothetical protein
VPATWVESSSSGQVPPGECSVGFELLEALSHVNGNNLSGNQTGSNFGRAKEAYRARAINLAMRLAF